MHIEIVFLGMRTAKRKRPLSQSAHIDVLAAEHRRQSDTAQVSGPNVGGDVGAGVAWTGSQKYLHAMVSKKHAEPM